MSQWEIKISSLFPILAFFFFRVSFAQSTGVGKWQDNNCYFCHHRLTDKLFLSTSDNSPSYYPMPNYITMQLSTLMGSIGTISDGQPAPNQQAVLELPWWTACTHQPVTFIFIYYFIPFWSSGWLLWRSYFIDFIVGHKNTRHFRCIKSFRAHFVWGIYHVTCARLYFAVVNSNVYCDKYE